jgi:hypothetical protein
VRGFRADVVLGAGDASPYDEHRIVAIELLHVRQGIDLEDMPDARALASFSELLASDVQTPA